MASYGSLSEKVALDVKAAARQVRDSWKILGAARDSRFSYEKTLAALQQQQDAGSPEGSYNPEAVQLRLQVQEQLASAEQSEHQAMYNYSFAIASLEKAKGTILRYNNVIMEEDQLPLGPKRQWGGPKHEHAMRRVA